MTMATFEHDSAGFLIGKLLKSSDRNEQYMREQVELLRSIYDSLVKPRGQNRSGRGGLMAAAPAGRMGLASAPMGRSVASAPGQAERSAVRLQAKETAKEAAKEARREESRKTPSKRDKNGRYVANAGSASGGADKDGRPDDAERSGIFSLLKRMGKASTEATAGASNIDPTLMATKEVGAALAPLGRGLSTLFSPMEKRSERRATERLWNKLFKKLGKDKEEKTTGGMFGGGGGGGFSFGGLASKLPSILGFALKRLFLPVAAAFAGWDLGKAFYNWLSGTEFYPKMLDAIQNAENWIRDTIGDMAAGFKSIPERIGQLFTSLDTAMRELPVIGKAYSATMDAAKTAAEAVSNTYDNMRAGFNQGANPTAGAAPPEGLAQRAGAILGRGAALTRSGVEVAATGAAAVGSAASTGVATVKKAAGKVSAKARELWDGGAKADIVGAATAAGIPADVMTKAVHLESGFNSNAAPVSRNGAMNTKRLYDGRMAMSTAHGYGQFLDGTWQGAVNKWGKKYGVAGAGKMTIDQANALRGDTKLQAAMMAELTAENIQRGRALGGSSDDANVYAFHNLGEGDAGRMLKSLKADPNTSMRDALIGGRNIDKKETARIDRVLANNPALYGNGTGTVGQAYTRMDTMMQRGAPFAAEAAAAQAALKAPSASIPVASAAIAKPASSAVPAAAAAAGSIPRMEDPRISVPLGGGSGNSLTLKVPRDTSQNVPDRQIAQIVTGGMN